MIPFLTVSVRAMQKDRCQLPTALPTLFWLATGSQAHTLETKSGCRAAFRSPNSASSPASCCYSYSLFSTVSIGQLTSNFQLSTAATEAINKSTRDMTYDGQLFLSVPSVRRQASGACCHFLGVCIAISLTTALLYALPCHLPP